MHCDDSVHAGSDLVLVEHKAPQSYMGTTVVFIPQCTGEPPTAFFLYPEHRVDFIKALKSLDKPMRRAQKAERALARAKDRAWKAVCAGPFPSKAHE